MYIIENKLKGKELKFCVCFADVGDAETAARLAGYKLSPEMRGRLLLARDDIQGEIKRLIENRAGLLRALAAAGCGRLAFGGAGDAVSLLYAEKLSRDELKNLDLFMVSEIKKPKDGSVEIKFFDRLKALERLENMSPQSGAENLFDAIGGSCGGSDSRD